MAFKKLLCVFVLVSCHLVSGENDLEADFDNPLVHMNIGESKNFSFVLRKLDLSNLEKFNTTIRVISSNSHIVEVFTEIISLNEIEQAELSVMFHANAINLGNAYISVELKQENLTKLSTEHMEIIVYRKRVLPFFNSQYLFLYLEFLHYFYVFMSICFGVVFDLKKVKEILRNPTAPLFGYVFDFVILPLVSHFVSFE